MKGVPDSPFSLMEGMGGTIVLYCDILLDQAVGKDFMRFPGYEVFI